MTTTIKFDDVIADLVSSKSGFLMSHNAEMVAFKPYKDEEGFKGLEIVGLASGFSSFVLIDHNGDNIKVVGDDYYLKSMERGKIFEMVVRPMSG